MKKIILALLLISAVTLSARSNKRDYLFQIGLGAADITYPEPLESSVDSLEDSGINRTTIHFDLTLGYAFLEDTYFTVGINGIGDRFEENGVYLQYNTYLFSVGFRHFPFDKGFYVGADIGSAVFIADLDGQDSYTSDDGHGIDLKLGYDFDSNKSGPSLAIGTSLNYYKIESDEIYSAAIAVYINFK